MLIINLLPERTYRYFTISIQLPESGIVANHEKPEKIQNKATNSSNINVKESFVFYVITSAVQRHTFQHESPYISRRRAIISTLLPDPRGPLNRMWGKLSCET